MNYLIYNGKRISLNGLSIIENSPVAPILPTTSMILQLDPWHATLQYDYDLDPLSIPQNSDFTVKVNSVNNPVIGIVIDGKSVYLELTNDVNAGDSVSVSYGGSTLKTSDTKIVSIFTDMTTTNQMSSSFSLNGQAYDFSLDKVRVYLMPGTLDTNYIPASSAFSFGRTTTNIALDPVDPRLILTVTPSYTIEELDLGSYYDYTRPRQNFLRDTKSGVVNSTQDVRISLSITEPWNVSAILSENVRIIKTIFDLKDDAFIDSGYTATSNLSIMDGRTGLPFANIVDVLIFHSGQYSTIQVTIDKDIVIDDAGHISIHYTQPVTDYIRYNSGMKVAEFAYGINVSQ